MHSLSENLILNEIHELMVKKQKIGIKSILERRFFKLIPAYLSSKKMPIKCHALYSSIFIGPNGAIYPCSIYNKKTLNIRDIDFDLKKLWNNKKIIVEIRNEIHNKKCSGCWTPCEAYPAILGSLPICLI